MAEGAAHLFVADLDAPELAAEDRHHVERVLRLRPGETVTVSDGRGRVRPCVVRAGGGLEPTADAITHPVPSPAIAIAFALVKGGRPDLIVQKLTECGVDRIIPFVASRSVVRWEKSKAAHNQARFVRIAREAAMQSRRPWLATVSPVVDFAAIMAEEGDRVALADPAGEPPTLSRPVVLIGPEGGWSAEEWLAAPATVRFGATVFRSETAAIAAGCLLSALRSGIVTPHRAR